MSKIGNKAREISDIATKLINFVGENNFEKVNNCFTRVRFLVRERNLVNLEEIKKLELVKGINWAGNELQVIFGGPAVKVREKIEEILTQKQGSFTLENKTFVSKDNQQGIWTKFLNLANGIIIPILPVLMTSGMFSGIAAILASTEVIQTVPPGGKGFLTDMNWYSGLIYIANNSGIALLSIFFCYSTVKYFKGDGMMGIMIGLVITSGYFWLMFDIDDSGISSLWSGEWILFKIGDFPIKIKAYNNNIIPAIGTALTYVYLDRFVKKWMPSSVDIVFRPLLVFVSVIAFAFLFLLPLLSIVEMGISAVAKVFYQIPYGIGGAVAGSMYLPFNISGFGWPIGFAFEEAFYSGRGPLKAVPIWDANAIAVFGIMLGLYFKQARQKDKTNDLTTGIPLLFGVPEPAMYGVLATKQKAFWLASLGNGVVGLLMALFKITRPTVGGYGLMGVIGHGTDYQSIGIFLGCATIGFILNFFLIFFFWNEKQTEEKLVKKSLRYFANHAWILSKKKNKKVKLSKIRQELNSINDEVKKNSKINQEFYKLYLKDQQTLNKLNVRKKKQEEQQAKFENEIQILEEKNQSTSFWQNKLVQLQNKINVYQQQWQNYQGKKQLLDLKAQELIQNNVFLYEKNLLILKTFFEEHQVVYFQEQLLNKFWNSLNDNLIMTGYLEAKDDQTSKAVFYQTEKKYLLKFLPKNF